MKERFAEGTLQFTKASYLGEEPEHPSYVIQKWETNPYYGREKNYIDDGDYYRDKECPNLRISKECFKDPTYCYVIASFDWDAHEELYEIEFIGYRPLELTDKQWIEFRSLLKSGYKQLNYGQETD